MIVWKAIRHFACVAVLLIPPSAANAVSKSFVIFFDPGSAAISANARAAIDQFVRTQRLPPKCFVVTVDGHLDGSEAAAGQTAVADRRIEAVAGYIEESAPRKFTFRRTNFGFSRPLVLTEPTKEEPQNRRVAIDIRYAPEVQTRAVPEIGGPGRVRAWLPDGTSCD